MSLRKFCGRYSVNLSRLLSVLGVAAVAATAGTSAMADDDAVWDSGFYVGANVGQSRAKIDDPRIISNLMAAGFTVPNFRNDERHLGYKLFGGYQFNKYFALEGGYFDLGRFHFTAFTNPPAGLTGAATFKGGNLDAVGFIPMGDHFSAFGRVGYAYTHAEDTFVGYGAVVVANPSPKQSSSNLKYGFGLQYAFGYNWATRAEVERYRVGDAVGNKGNIDLVTLGVLYRFGSPPAAPAPAAYVPPPPPPAPEPVVVVVPVPDATQKYCSILDIQFEINVDVMEKEVKEKLQVIGTFLAKYPNTTAVIEGHTDNVGTDEANMKLSQRRADSVVRYLVDDLHINAARLSAVGYGERRPIADNKTEDGKRQNRRIDAVVACASDIAGLTVKPERMTIALAMEFDRGKADIKPQYHNDLQNAANFLISHPTVTATVEGHTSNSNPDPKMQQQISLARAQSVVNYLVDKFGIDRSRLTARGFGDTRRVAYNTSAEGREENRRVNIIINYPKRAGDQ